MTSDSGASVSCVFGVNIRFNLVLENQPVISIRMKHQYWNLFFTDTNKTQYSYVISFSLATKNLEKKIKVFAEIKRFHKRK